MWEYHAKKVKDRKKDLLKLEKSMMDKAER